MDGVDLKDYNIQWLRHTIALVGKLFFFPFPYVSLKLTFFHLIGQEPVLFSGSIADNIGYSVKGASLDQIEEAAKSANAHNFITQFPDGYRTQVGEKGIFMLCLYFCVFYYVFKG